MIDNETFHQLAATEKEQRRHVRRRVLWVGKVDTEDGSFDCIVLDVSRSGVKLRFAEPIPPQTTVNLAFGSFGALDAEVIWQRGEKMGIRFNIEPEQVANIIGPALGI